MNFLMNAWYVAATSAEVNRTPMRRVLVEQPVVFYRKRDGTAVALFDRCPHRLVPLSRGRLQGDEIECGYHGLRFDCSGKCSLNPHGGPIPEAAKVRSFPVIERYGYLWLWPGAPEKASADLLPNIAAFEDPTYKKVGGYLHIKANYQLMIDNLLDLSHSEYLHPAFRGGGSVEEHRVEVIRDGDTVHSNRWKPNSPTTQFQKLFWESSSDYGDSRANIRWDPPGTLYLDTGVTEVGHPVTEGVTVPTVHLVSPETGHTTHYFWAIARNCRTDDASLDKAIQHIGGVVFNTQDEPMIEAQQLEIGEGTDLMDLKPVLLRPDQAAVLARRILAGRIKEEQR